MGAPPAKRKFRRAVICCDLPNEHIGLIGGLRQRGERISYFWGGARAAVRNVAGTTHLCTSFRFGQATPDEPCRKREHRSQGCHDGFGDCRCAGGVDQRSRHIWPVIDHRYDP